MRSVIITIDGPAASGKSTAARLLAQKLEARFSKDIAVMHHHSSCTEPWSRSGDSTRSAANSFLKYYLQLDGQLVNDWLKLFSQMMQVHHSLPDAALAQPAGQLPQHGAVPQGHKRLGADPRQRQKPSPESRTEKHHAKHLDPAANNSLDLPQRC